MRKSLLLLIIILLAVMALNLDTIRSHFSPDSGIGRLDTASGEQAARTSLGSILRDIQALKMLNNGNFTSEEAASVIDDPHVRVEPAELGVYNFIYTFETATSRGACALNTQTEAITC